MTQEDYKYKLPHRQYFGEAFLMTWRLKDSIPKSDLQRVGMVREVAIEDLQRKKLSDELAQLELNKIESRYFEALDSVLDKIETGPHWLKQADIAQIAMDKMREYDGKYYRLEAFCVMSNHVHALFDFGIQLQDNGQPSTDYVQLDKVMQLIKGGSGYTANKALGRSGSFWERLNFDRYIRNERHYNNVINYILNNPVKAGLCKDWRDYPYTWLRPLALPL